MKAVCFGDSNTWGYDPRSYFGGRYGEADRWPEILAAATGWEVVNRGENGRRIPAGAQFPPDAGLVIVMLGGNDLLQGLSPERAAERLRAFLASLSISKDKLLLIAPPAMSRGAWVPDGTLVAASREFARLCRETAEGLGVLFADASGWGVGLAYDGVHFTEEGHRAFAARLMAELARAGFIPAAGTEDI